jgi:hypothetical protein
VPFGWFDRKPEPQPVVDAEPSDHDEPVIPPELAIQQLRLRRKELALLKRALIERQREVRAAYTDKTRKPGFLVTMMPSKEQTLWRKANRRSLAGQLRPLEQQRQQVETELTRVDLALLQLQSSTRAVPARDPTPVPPERKRAPTKLDSTSAQPATASGASDAAAPSDEWRRVQMQLAGWRLDDVQPDDGVQVVPLSGRGVPRWFADAGELDAFLASATVDE